MGGHVFLEYMSQDDMSYGSICLKRGHALLDDMSYRRTCLAGVHAFRIAYLKGLCVLLKGMSYSRACLTCGHFLLEYMYDRMAYLAGSFILEEDILQEDRCYWRICIIGVYVLHKGMPYRWACLRGVYVL